MQAEAQTAAGSALIYRFVCHPSIAYVSPTIVYVTSVLIPAKPEEDDGEVWSSFGQGMLQDLALSSGSMHGDVPIRKKNSRFPALCASEQWSHGCHGKDNNPEHLVCRGR